MVKVVFQSHDGGSETVVDGAIGDTLLDVAHAHNIDIEGACEGNLSCSTCHIIVAAQDYDRLPPPEEEEEDMLDLAFGLTETSRLGCQIVMREDYDGLTVRLPKSTRNLLLA